MKVITIFLCLFVTKQYMLVCLMKHNSTSYVMCTGDKCLSQIYLEIFFMLPYKNGLLSIKNFTLLYMAHSRYIYLLFYGDNIIQFSARTFTFLEGKEVLVTGRGFARVVWQLWNVCYPQMNTS